MRRGAVVASVLVGFVLAAAACGEESNEPLATTTSVTVAVAPEVVLRDVELSDGSKRRYGAFVPDGHSGTMPAVIVLNFVGANYSTEDPPAKIAAAAKANGFVAVVPESVEASWNAGTCCGGAAERGIADAEFVTRLIPDLIEAAPVDPERVYLVGYSNGGMLAAGIACDDARGIAGIALVEATLLDPTCEPRSPITLLQLHQIADPIVPFEGTTTSDLATDGILPPVLGGFERFVDAQGCDAGSQRTDPSDGVQTISHRCPGGTRAELVIIPGGSHAWPDGVAVPIDATQFVVEQFGLAAK